MSKIVLNIGAKIELEHIRSSHGGSLSEKRYSSQLLEYDGVKNAKILMPIHENRVIPLEVGDEYNLCFYTGSVIYQCQACITKRYLEKKVYILCVEFVTSLKRNQRREFFRLDCMLTIKYRILPKIEETLLNQMESKKLEYHKKELGDMTKEWNIGELHDVSGGGIRFQIKIKNGSQEDLKIEQKPETDDELVVYLPLEIEDGEVTPIKLITRVISCTEDEDSRSTFVIRGTFVEIKDAERELIVKYVFEEQRRRLKRD